MKYTFLGGCDIWVCVIFFCVGVGGWDISLGGCSIFWVGVMFFWVGVVFSGWV